MELPTASPLPGVRVDATVCTECLRVLYPAVPPAGFSLAFVSLWRGSESLLRVRNASNSVFAIKVRPPAFTRLSFPCESQADTVQCDTLSNSAASFVVNRSPTSIFIAPVWVPLALLSPLCMRLYRRCFDMNKSKKISKDIYSLPIFPVLETRDEWEAYIGEEADPVITFV